MEEFTEVKEEETLDPKEAIEPSVSEEALKDVEEPPKVDDKELQNLRVLNDFVINDPATFDFIQKRLSGEKEVKPSEVSPPDFFSPEDLQDKDSDLSKYISNREQQAVNTAIKPFEQRLNRIEDTQKTTATRDDRDRQVQNFVKSNNIKDETDFRKFLDNPPKVDVQSLYAVFQFHKKKNVNLNIPDDTTPPVTEIGGNNTPEQKSFMGEAIKRSKKSVW